MTTTRGSDKGSCLGLRVPGERVEPDRNTLRIPFDPLEVHTDDLLHPMLALARGVDQLAVAFHEQIKSVRLKCLIDQRVFDSKLAAHVVERAVDLWEPHAAAPARRRNST